MVLYSNLYAAGSTSDKISDCEDLNESCVDIYLTGVTNLRNDIWYSPIIQRMAANEKGKWSCGNCSEKRYALCEM